MSEYKKNLKIWLFRFWKNREVTVAHVSVFEEAAELARVLPVATPSSAALLAAMTSDERSRFFDALINDFLDRQGEGPYAVTNEALIAIGSKPRTNVPIKQETSPRDK